MKSGEQPLFFRYLTIFVGATEEATNRDIIRPTMVVCEPFERNGSKFRWTSRGLSTENKHHDWNLQCGE